MKHMTKQEKVKGLVLGIFLAVILIAGICWAEKTSGAAAPADYQGAVFAEAGMDGMPWIQLLSI